MKFATFAQKVGPFPTGALATANAARSSKQPVNTTPQLKDAMLTPTYQKALTALVTKFEADLQAVNRAIATAVLAEVQRTVDRATRKPAKVHVDLSSLKLTPAAKPAAKPTAKRTPKTKPATKATKTKTAKAAKPQRIRLVAPILTPTPEAKPLDHAKLQELGAALAVADAEAAALDQPTPVPAPEIFEPAVGITTGVVIDVETLPETSSETLEVAAAVVPADALVVEVSGATSGEMPDVVANDQSAQIAPGKRCPRCHRIAPKPTGYCILCHPKPAGVLVFGR